MPLSRGYVERVIWIVIFVIGLFLLQLGWLESFHRWVLTPLSYFKCSLSSPYSSNLLLMCKIYVMLDVKSASSQIKESVFLKLREYRILKDYPVEIFDHWKNSIWPFGAIFHERGKCPLKEFPLDDLSCQVFKSPPPTETPKSDIIRSRMEGEGLQPSSWSSGQGVFFKL